MNAPSLAEAVENYLSGCIREGECLVSPRNHCRYGEVRYGNPAKRMSAHRAVYIVRVAVIPRGMVVRHRCDNMRCVRPEHLEIGTTAQNVRDIYDRDRRDAPWRQGDTHPCAKLTAALVAELRRRVMAGERLDVLAVETGIRYLTICSAVRGRTWAHIVDPPPVPGLRRASSSRALSRTRPEDCRRAARMADAGLALSQIAQCLDVSRHTAFKLAAAGRGVA